MTLAKMMTESGRVRMTVGLLCVVWCTAVTSEAVAACATPPTKQAFAVPKLALSNLNAVPALDDAQGGGASIVGMWNVEFLFGDGPDRYDQGFQLFHADGTEMMLSNGLPPALGNVCLGVWKKVAPRTVKLRHMAWNWTTEGAFAGTFELLVTLRLDRHGDSVAGTWVAESFDPDGNVIPGLHAEGVVRASRITAD